MRPVLLVTNDYPPKLGGIQSYLYELWRRLPGELVAGVLTIDHPEAAAFDRRQPYWIERRNAPMLLPTPRLRRQIADAVARTNAALVVLDPALPLGALGPHLGLPYAVILHGAEVTVPARLPGTAPLLRRVLANAQLLIAAGGYPAAEARRLLRRAAPPVVVVPPGVDLGRFAPLTAEQRVAARRRFGLPETGRLVLGVSRLVPRKGFDVLIEAAAELAHERPDLCVALGGTGRDARRLASLAERSGAPVRLLGRIPEADLAALVGAADICALPCRDRWLGLEQEGFGIVFLEAAAAGVPALAGRSGGTEEAVLDGVTGLVADRPADAAVVTAALARLLDDVALRERLGAAARRRALEEFGHDRLAATLAAALDEASMGAVATGARRPTQHRGAARL